MDFDRSAWVPVAEGLKLGNRTRINHLCGEGRTLLVSRSQDGLRAWCFRCNDGDSLPPPQESIAEKLARFKQQASADLAAGTPKLPTPMILDVALWPDAARLWLYKAGLGRAEIGKLGAYYHPPTNRVVLPLYDGITPVFWQARSIDGRQPKYLAPVVSKAHLLPRWGKAPSITITEDILSAFKVGLVAEGWCALGTRANDKMLFELLRDKRPVNVALDPDAAGQRGATKLITQLRAYGIDASNVVFPKDPKMMPLDTLKGMLC